jgi:hypothetical protein
MPLGGVVEGQGRRPWRSRVLAFAAPRRHRRDPYRAFHAAGAAPRRCSATSAAQEAESQARCRPLGGRGRRRHRGGRRRCAAAGSDGAGAHRGHGRRGRRRCGPVLRRSPPVTERGGGLWRQLREARQRQPESRQRRRRERRRSRVRAAPPPADAGDRGRGRRTPPTPPAAGTCRGRRMADAGRFSHMSSTGVPMPLSLREWWRPRCRLYRAATRVDPCPQPWTPFTASPYHLRADDHQVA